MRALLVGLLAFGSSLEAAYAEPCRLDGLELVAEGTPRVDDDAWHTVKYERPDLIGKTFKVVRVASEFRRINKTLPRPYTADGTVSVVVSTGSEQFFVQQIYDGRTIPEEQASSYVASASVAENVRWGHRATKAEAVRVNGYFDIFDGPLNGLVLRPVNCKQPE